MKKLVLMFVAIAAISFASCGGNNSKPAANADSTADSTVDSLSSDSAANTVAADSTAAADSVK